MTNDKQFNPQGATCRNCGNTGVGFTGAPCPCTVKYSNPKPRYADVLKQENEALKSENARLQVELKSTQAKTNELKNENYALVADNKHLSGSVEWLKKELIRYETEYKQQLDAANFQLQGAREAFQEICDAQPQRDGQWNPTLKTIAARALSTLPNPSVEVLQVQEQGGRL